MTCIWGGGLNNKIINKWKVKSIIFIIKNNIFCRNNEGDSVQAADEFLQTATDLEEHMEY